MAICYSCRSIRLGANGGGDTLMEALSAVESVMRMGLASPAYEMLNGIIQQARERGVCYSCISDMQSLKSKLGKHI